MLSQILNYKTQDGGKLYKMQIHPIYRDIASSDKAFNFAAFLHYIAYDCKNDR